MTAVTGNHVSHGVRAAAVRSRVSVPLRFPDGYTATADVLTFDGLVDGKEHLLLGLGGWEQALLHRESERPAPLVRLHSECLTGDVFGSERCDCGPQLREGVEEIAATGGFLLYLRQEGRGIGLYAKLDAYALQDEGLNNPDKAAQLTSLGIAVAEQVPTGAHLSAANGRYLAAKRDHTAHTLKFPA